jgi:hypothetical protein
VTRVRVVAIVLLVLGAASAWRALAQSDTPGYNVSARSLIREVATAYGDTRPQVLGIERTYTDDRPHEPVYFVHLGGTFRRGHATADELYFSALADRQFLWAVMAYRGQDGHRRAAWTDCPRSCTGTLR